MNTIDLTNPARTQDILLTDYHQRLPLKRHWLGFYQTSNWRLHIRVANLRYEGILIGSPEELIKLKINDQEGSDLTLDVTSRDLYFSSFINTGEILDCEHMEDEKNADRIYKITYQVQYSIVSDRNPVWRYINDGHGDATFEHEFKFSRIHQQANFHFRDNAVEFNLTDNTKVICGELDLTLKHLFRRAPYLNMDFSLSVIQDTPNGEISRTDIVAIDKYDVHETEPFAAQGDSNLRPDGTKASVLDFEYLPVERLYHLGQFYVNGDHHVTLPVRWDLSVIKNPREATEVYTLVMKGQYWSGNDESGKKDFRHEFPVTIQRNTKQTDLEVFIAIPTARAEPETYVLIADEENLQPSYTAREVLVNVGTRRDFNLVIGNTAEAPSNPGAAVRVRHLRLEGPFYPEGIEVQMAPNIETPFEISGQNLLKRPDETVNLMFGEKDTTRIRYKANAITGFTRNGVKCFETEARFDFSFQYIVDPDGTCKNPMDGDFKGPFQGSIKLPLAVAPSPEWMCIDFGTSAVVAEYGKSIYDEQGNLCNNLVNLRAKKTDLLKKTFDSSEANKRVDKNESDTEFISSLIAFNFNMEGLLNNYDKIRPKKDFKNSSIWFSPSSSMVDPNSLLPCLKSLMGYERLPKGIFLRDDENKIANHDISMINKIYSIAYRQLFTYYVPNGIEKLVLSIPNTFAPIHLKMLREIAINCIPTLRKNRIRFVSESDAVAYYYLSRRNEILGDSGIPRIDWKDVDQNTIVYDMGAGTLDLTYFVKKETPQLTEIEIKGKIGVNKAGNYIDYLIAEILADLLHEKGKDNLGGRITKCLVLDRDRRDGSITNSDCNELKAYIRDSVKPALNSPEAILADWDKDLDHELQGLTGRDILNHERFKAFLKEITDNVFQSFTALFGKDGKIPVDLVIFSGRSTSMQVIRDSIMDRISAFNAKNGCRFVDIAAERFVERGQTIDQADVKGLKYAVAAGALAYPTLLVADENAENRTYWVRNKNVYATYGIMAHSAQGWQWYPLIDSKTRPTSSAKSVNGLDIACYDSSRYSIRGDNKPLTLPLGIIDSIYVLQTYSVDTLGDWKKKDKEMITILYYQNTANYKRDEVVALKITQDNEIVLWIGDAPKEMYAHDDFYNTSFRKSMWPVIFSESQNHA